MRVTSTRMVSALGAFRQFEKPESTIHGRGWRNCILARRRETLGASTRREVKDLDTSAHLLSRSCGKRLFSRKDGEPSARCVSNSQRLGNYLDGPCGLFSRPLFQGGQSGCRPEGGPCFSDGQNDDRPR